MTINFNLPFVYLPLFDLNENSIFAFAIFKDKKMIINIKNLCFGRIRLRINWCEVFILIKRYYPWMKSVYVDGEEKKRYHFKDYFSKLIELSLSSESLLVELTFSKEDINS
jgi:hypothetical protein